MGSITERPFKKVTTISDRLHDIADDPVQNKKSYDYVEAKCLDFTKYDSGIMFCS